MTKHKKAQNFIISRLVKDCTRWLRTFPSQGLAKMLRRHLQGCIGQEQYEAGFFKPTCPAEMFGCDIILIAVRKIEQRVLTLRDNKGEV